MKEKRKLDNQTSLMRRILKWVWRLGLIFSVIIFIAWIAIQILFYTPMIAYLNRYRVCHNMPAPQYQALPENLISLDELDAVVARLNTANPNYQFRQSGLANVYQYPTHPQGAFYFVEQRGFYKQHIFACSHNKEFQPLYFGYDTDSEFDNFTWTYQGGELYVVHILYRFDTQSTQISIYDGNSLELITRRFTSHERS